MYKCENKDCPMYGKVQTPGGRITYKDGVANFTGSKCKTCGKEMKLIPKEPTRFGSIINPGDGRHS